MARTESCCATLKTIASPYDSRWPGTYINHTRPPAYPAYKSNIARAIVALWPLKIPALVNPIALANGAYARTPHNKYLVAGTRVEYVIESRGTADSPRIH